MNGIPPNMTQMVAQDRQYEILGEAAKIRLNKQVENGERSQNQRIIALLASRLAAVLIRFGEFLENAAGQSNDINPQSA